MKFTLSINMERTSPAVDMRDVARQHARNGADGRGRRFRHRLGGRALHHRAYDPAGAVPAPCPSCSATLPP